MYLPQAVLEDAQLLMHVLCQMSVLAITTSCILYRQLLFTYWDESEKDISHTQFFLLATSTALSFMVKVWMKTVHCPVSNVGH